MAPVSVDERQLALAGVFPRTCHALGDELRAEFDRYIEQYPDPVYPFRNEEQLFALHLLQRFALITRGDAVTAAVYEDLAALRRRDPAL